ncbi:MAG: multidrug transporter AcrB [Candidatus Pelagibacter sp. TMED64]|nr:multidrug transporter AcrB [Candidatus Pelagibacter sp.]OUU65015.1 MAG: multidrug transporter AcrB [Candidatus Pelagibacter sp. TMED64]|tara:strand:- start:4288 stop:7416 length:3129 start_codon:yes stop_codon:yes gene_type:complete
MYLTELSIKRPVVATVFSLILVTFGLFVFSKLPVRELPSGLQPPVVQIQVDYQGANAEVVSTEITEIIEDVIGGAEGIKNIDSISENGRSTIKIEFNTNINLDNAANDIRDRVSRVSDNLPEDSKAPEILKQSAGFTTSMWLSVSSSTWTDLEIGDYTRRYLVDSFSNVEGVGRIRIGGLRELSVRVYIDPIKLAANNLTIQEVEQSLRKENISLPAGSLEANNIDLTINLDKAYKDLSSIKQLPIKKNRNNIIRLENIAKISYGPVSEKTLFKSISKIGSSSDKVVGIGIYAKSGASTVELSKKIRERIVDVQKTLPDELKLAVSFDRATYINAAISEVYKTLIIAFLLVVIIIYLFLGNLKAVIVPAVALPVSLISSFLGLWIFDLSINIFVLLSFILAIGIITDDSVIMTDAIYHRVENGETSLVAAMKGSKSITFAIISTTLVLVAVFLPLIFIEGISGTLFKETAISLTFAIVVSSFVALTLSPMLGSKFLNRNTKKTKIVLKFEKYFLMFSAFYSETLDYWITKNKTIVTFIFFIVIASVLLFAFAPKELLPKEDRGVYLVIGKTDEGSSFQYTSDKAQVIEKRLTSLVKDENESYKRMIMRVPGFGRSSKSYNSFIIIALLDDWNNRKESSEKIMRKAIGKIVTVPQALAFPISPQSIRVSSYNKPVQMVLLGKSYEELENWQNLMIKKMRKNKNLAAIESDFSRNKPEIKLIINRKKSQDLGISIQSIGKTIETLYSGKTVTKFNKLGKEYPIILQSDIENRKKSESLSKIFVRSETTGKLISLANLVDFEEVGSAKILARYDRQRAVTISARLIGNYTLSEALNYLEQAANETIPQARIKWKGKSEELKETSNELFIIFALALLTAFLVMAANFNSFVHPAVIMLTVPLSVFGGIIFILLFNSSINVFSQIALIILIGISTKNSILIVDWANQLRRAGKNIQNAVLEACKRRFRAIIMTSLSTMIAMVPLLIGNIGPGAGEGSRLAVGTTIFGGMLISTFFTLYVTPTMYVLLTKNTKRIDAVDLQLIKELKK